MTNVPETTFTPSPLNPVIYVCLLSQYTVATAQAIKEIRPEQVIAISSTWIKNNGVEKRFADLVDSWGIPLTILGSTPETDEFETETLDGSEQWMQQNLSPLLQKLHRADLRFFANLTGSTKPAVLALNKIRKWDERHYTSERSRNIINTVGHPSGETLYSFPCLTLREEAGLLNDKLRNVEDSWTDVTPETLRSCAQFIYEDYRKGRDAAVLSRNEELLHGLWFLKGGRRTAILEKYGIIADKKKAFLPEGELRDFFLNFRELDPTGISEEDGRLCIPADGKAPLPRFIAGIWWEVMTENWFAEEGLPTLSNVVIVRKEIGSADAESDLLVRSAKGALLVVECKAALPQAAGAGDIVKLLNDLMSRFGKTRGILAVGPAFWWNFKEDQEKNFREACRLRGIDILESREDVKKWTAPSEENRPSYPIKNLTPAPEVCNAEEILQEARSLLGAWEEEKIKRFEELRKEFSESHPERNDFGKLIFCNNEIRFLFKAAYESGRGYPQARAISELRERAQKLNLHWVTKAVDKKFKNGQAAAERRKNELKAKASGKALSTVKPRPNKAAPVTPLPVSDQKCTLPEPPHGLHPNDIRALKPASNWTLLLDETGSRFSSPSGTDEDGKFVGLLVNSDTPGLPPLKEGWHAVECNSTKEVDQVVQNVLDAPCGIIGLPLTSLPNTRGEMWLDGMLNVVDWVLRLLPIKGKTSITVAIEGRSPFPPRVQALTVARDALRRLARVWPDRAADIDLKIDTIGKNDHPLNGYVDALAYTWGSPTASSKERLQRSELVGTCFLNFDARTMGTFWDTWDRPGGISPAQWADLVASRDADNRASIAWSLLFNLAVACVRDESRITPYLEETRRHLASKAINLPRLGKQIDWLQAVLGNLASLPPSMRLVWLTAKLAQANHMGAVEETWMQELTDLRKLLWEEDAPLVCHADLHRAVNATNRFDFATAGQILEQWQESVPAIPGLRYWSQVQSSLGQVQAFLGNGQEAQALFDRAMEGFSRLSEPAAREKERSQTLCYKLITAMDTPEVTDPEVEALMREYLRLMHLPEDPAGAAALLAGSTASEHKYVHHVLLRWLVLRGDEPARVVYLGKQEEWDTGHGHPWPLIQLYRAILLRETDSARASELAMDGAALAFMADQGPTVNLIGCCCRAVAAAWGTPWDEAQEILTGLQETLPPATDRIGALETWLANPDTLPVQMLGEILPFNFR